jgi:hypothetical protein
MTSLVDKMPFAVEWHIRKSFGETIAATELRLNSLLTWRRRRVLNITTAHVERLESAGSRYQSLTSRNILKTAVA